MDIATQPGITPPAPGQEKEEPELWQEDDIPDEDSTAKGSASDDKSQHHPERGKRDE